MFCHMALWDKDCNADPPHQKPQVVISQLAKILQIENFYLSGEHFVTVRTGYALDSAVFRLAHVDVSDVRAEVGLGGENPHTEMTSLVARVV